MSCKCLYTLNHASAGSHDSKRMSPFTSGVNIGSEPRGSRPYILSSSSAAFRSYGSSVPRPAILEAQNNLPLVWRDFDVRSSVSLATRAVTACNLAACMLVESDVSWRGKGVGLWAQLTGAYEG